jgi:hypothetical protein
MVRRVVTGHDESGQSVVVSDSAVDPISFGTAGGAVYPAWGRDGAARVPDARRQPRWRSASPPVGDVASRHSSYREVRAKRSTDSWWRT